MADYYTQCSLEVETGKDGGDWLAEAIRCIELIERGDEYDPGDYTGYPLHEGDFPRTPSVAEALEDWGWGFSYKRTGAGVWIYCDESGNIDLLADLLQEYLQRFDRDGRIGFSWAETCSKSRVGAFGGGAAFVTDSDFKVISTVDWLEKQQRSQREEP
jgi:hypothetical protein